MGRQCPRIESNAYSMSSWYTLVLPALFGQIRTFAVCDPPICYFEPQTVSYLLLYLYKYTEKTPDF